MLARALMVTALSSHMKHLAAHVVGGRRGQRLFGCHPVAESSWVCWLSAGTPCGAFAPRWPRHVEGLSAHYAWHASWCSGLKYGA